MPVPRDRVIAVLKKHHYTVLKRYRTYGIGKGGKILEWQEIDDPVGPLMLRYLARTFKIPERDFQ